MKNFIVISFVIIFASIISNYIVKSLFKKSDDEISTKKCVAYLDNNGDFIVDETYLNSDGDKINYHFFTAYYSNLIEKKHVDVENAPNSVKMYYYILKYSKIYGIPKNIAFGMARFESSYNGLFDWGYNPNISSSSNAYGALQIKTSTAKYINKKYYITEEDISKESLINNLDLNINIGLCYLHYLYKKHGSWDLALGAYNTGKPKVNSYAVKVSNFDPSEQFIK
jgi:soluble lytic murein transglycosylase-like protein